MAGRYNQNFTLTDIFNNKNLKGKLPLINYKETLYTDGKLTTRTNAKSVNRVIFDTAISAARPYYSPINATRGGNILEISGEMVGDHDACVDAVYNAIMAKRSILIWTANNADMVRSALKEAEKNRRYFGIQSKLYLRAGSMQQIEAMSKPQIQALMADIMENIFYGDNFPETQKKYNVKNIDVGSYFSYEERKRRWKEKIGEFE